MKTEILKFSQIILDRDANRTTQVSIWLLENGFHPADTSREALHFEATLKPKSFLPTRGLLGILLSKRVVRARREFLGVLIFSHNQREAETSREWILEIRGGKIHLVIAEELKRKLQSVFGVTVSIKEYPLDKVRVFELFESDGLEKRVFSPAAD